VASSGTPYRYEKADGYAVISLEPELNNAQWSEIEQIGTDLLAQLRELKSQAMIVDLSALSYMGSAMVALIVRLWKSVKEDDGRMVVVNRDPNVLEVLKLASLDKVWTIEETKDGAVKALGKRLRPEGGRGGGNSMLIVGVAVVLLVLVAGIAFWAGRMGADGGALPSTPPEDSSSDETGSDAPAETDGADEGENAARPAPRIESAAQYLAQQTSSQLSNSGPPAICVPSASSGCV